MIRLYCKAKVVCFGCNEVMYHILLFIELCYPHTKKKPYFGCEYLKIIGTNKREPSKICNYS